MENNLLTKDYDEFFTYFKNKIDDPNLSKNELLSLKERALELYSQYENLELTVKKDANSLYGTSANAYFSLRDYNVSTDITMAGKHSTVKVDIAINNFFFTWANNHENVQIIKDFYPNANVKNNVDFVFESKTDMCVYGDTDSRYINLERIYYLIGIDFPKDDYELSDFGLLIVDNFINKIIETTIKEDAEYRNAYPGYLNMTHEVTARTCAYMGKKQYIMTLVWKDGKKINRKLKFTGIELKKGSMSPRLKKMIGIIINKFFIDDLPFEKIQKEIIGCFKYIITRQERSFIYKISTVNELDLITLNESTGKYVSEKGHIQHKIAIFWMNFIKNDNEKIYKVPFEGQKMNWYYDENGDVVGVPDDVDIDKVKNLPKPDYVRMLKAIFIKNLLKYITEYQNKDITEKVLTTFLANVNKIKF